MSLRILLLSNSTNPGGTYLGHCAEDLVALFEQARRIAFVPYALGDLDAYAEMARSRFAELGLSMDPVHRTARPAVAIQESDGIFVGGGNTFRLLHRVRGLGLLEAIRARVQTGAPYAGASAGSNLACPTIKTTNDMPIVDPGGLDALGLVPFQVNPHYVDRDPDVPHGGETREQRITEFLEENETPVIGLREGSVLKIADDAMTLLGTRAARLFVQGETPRELPVGTSLDQLLTAVRRDGTPPAKTL